MFAIIDNCAAWELKLTEEGESDRVPLYADAADHQPVRSRLIAISNDFGISEAIVGVAVGFVISAVAVGIYTAATNKPAGIETLATDTLNLVGLWIGLVGAAVVASHLHSRKAGTAPTLEKFRTDYGVELRLWPDLLIGIVVGIGAQYLLIPVLELPLLPFVPHLFTRLGSPAKQLTHGVHGGGLVLLGFLICLGSPLVEELFFRGLFLRGLLGRFSVLGARPATVISVLVAGIFFGLLHFEALQFIGLAGFGVVLGILATRTGRLGPGLVAHVSFNTVTFIVLVTGH